MSEVLITSPPRHIGIVACSAEGAALCYRSICQRAGQRLGAHRHPEVSLHGHDLARYVACLESGDAAGVGALMLDSARKLASLGADFLICPDNTIHAALPTVAERMPLPWLHIAEVVASEAHRRGLKRPAILGTRWLVDSEVYPRALAAHDIGYLRPDVEQRAQVAEIIMGALVPAQGEFSGLRDQLLAIVETLVGRGCDGVILGCTELPLLLDEATTGLPTLDSTQLLAEAALERALT